MYDDSTWYEDDIDNDWLFGDDDNSGEFYNPPNRKDIEYEDIDWEEGE